jgi:hypothetical protein
MIKNLLREGLVNLYEGRVKSTLTEGPIALFEIVKGYYEMTGDYQIDGHNVNELYVYLKEEEDFDPLGHGVQPTEKPVDKNICVLSFSTGNEKLDWPYLSLPAGYTCPFATACKNFAAKAGQKFKDGSSLKAASDKTKHMCYAARAQAQYPGTNKKAFSNLSLIMQAQKDGGVDGMAKLIIDSIKYAGLEGSRIFRIHEAGDFFSNNYMKAWILVSQAFPNINFYTHTTSLQYWLSNRGSMPKNFRLIASMDDDNKETILANKLRYSKVVYSVEQAKEERLPIDYDDSIACCKDVNFALLIHGGQPKGSEAGKAVSTLRKTGTYDKLKQLHKTNKSSRQDLMR